MKIVLLNSVNTKKHKNQIKDRITKSRGFSLIELIVTVAIVAILMAAATPSFLSFIQNSRIQNQSDKLFTALHQARQLAITNNTKGFLCRTYDEFPRTSGIRCSTDLASQENWHTHSYMTYTIDVSSSAQRANLLTQISGTGTNGTLNSLKINNLITTTADREKQVQSYENFEDADPNTTINTNRRIHVVAFNSDGTLLNNAPVYFAICDERLENFGKYIEIAQSGRIRLASTTETSVNTLTDCNPST